MKLIYMFLSCCVLTAVAVNPKYLQPYAPYYSQCGQDKYLNEKIFKYKKGGVFVDVGAHDGVSYSNTYYFEKQLKWNGICIEPHKERYNELVKYRMAKAYQVCATDKNGVCEFLKISGETEMLSGLKDHYDPRHLERIKYECEISGSKQEVVAIEAKTLASIFVENNIKHVDFISIDVEGGELSVLKGIDFESVVIDYILVERNYSDDKSVAEFLIKKGFRLHSHVEIDDLYVRVGIANK